MVPGSALRPARPQTPQDAALVRCRVTSHGLSLRLERGGGVSAGLLHFPARNAAGIHDLAWPGPSGHADPATKDRGRNGPRIVVGSGRSMHSRLICASQRAENSRPPAAPIRQGAGERWEPPIRLSRVVTGGSVSSAGLVIVCAARRRVWGTVPGVIVVPHPRPCPANLGRPTGGQMPLTRDSGT